MEKYIPAWANKSTFWGMAWGAVLATILGFSFGGWTLESTAKRMAEEKADKAVVSVLAPICVDRFKRAPDVAANLAAFQKASSWDQKNLIAKGGWATIGTKEPNDNVAEACAEMLVRSLAKK